MVETEEKSVVYFGRTNFRNANRLFGIKRTDRRQHMYVIGQTGTGKTALLYNMIIQDIANGEGVCVVDPHGELIQNILGKIPEERVKDVIYFNPADSDFHIGFNILETPDPKYKHLVASGLMGIFTKIWSNVWSARMEYILNNSILALLEYPNTTLLGINRMLADAEYRKKIVEKVTDPVVKAFWVQEFARYTQRYEIEATAAIQNKVGQFISNPLIRNIVGQVKSKIDMREIMDDGKILIANISKGKVGEDNSRLLGALLITKLQLAAMSRVDVPEEKRRDFFLYVDEFQNFATEAFVNILSEARKYRLSLVLGNQYIAQLEEMTPTGKSTKVRDAIFGNVGTIITFRVGAEDAEYFEKEFTPEFIAGDLVNLPKYNIYLKLMIDGLAGRPFSAETLPPLDKQEKSNKEKIIKVARERYGTPGKIVEGKIIRWSKVFEENAPIISPKPASTLLYDAKCSLCGKWTKVTFPPDGVRPVYCKSCLRKIKESPFKEVQKTSLPPISLKEAVEKGPVSFSRKKEVKEEKINKKKVNLEELKEALKKAINQK